MNYYREHAISYAASTFEADMSKAYETFLPYIKPECRLLDLGSGSGRDACAFRNRGYLVTALEPSEELCVEIRKHFEGEIVNSDILSYHPEEPYDAIWACASLLHLTEDALMTFFGNIDRYLADGGVIYVSAKSGITTGYDEKGRYFLNFTEELLEKILSSHEGLVLKKCWYSDDVAGRSEFKWMNFVLGIEYPNHKK